MESPTYLRDHTLASIVRSSIEIYKSHFGVIAGVYLLPMLPFAIAYGITEPGSVPESISNILMQLWMPFAIAPITVAVSDICLNHKPNIGRCYSRLASAWGRLLGTVLLQGLAIIIGLILLIVPGVIASILLMFTLTTVVLEGRSGINAMRRSIDLVRGFAWRNFGVVLVMTLLYLSILLLIVIPIGLVATAGVSGQLLGLLGVLVGLVVEPLLPISIVLLYYDMRSRKENYDAAALANDMMV